MSVHDRAAALRQRKRFTLTVCRTVDSQYGCYQQTHTFNGLTQSEVDAEKAHFVECYPPGKCSSSLWFDVERE